MNETIKSKLLEFLNSTFEEIKQADIELYERVDGMLEIQNILKFIENYDELKPILQKFFIEKARKEKWGER